MALAVMGSEYPIGDVMERGDAFKDDVLRVFDYG